MLGRSDSLDAPWVALGDADDEPALGCEVARTAPADGAAAGWDPTAEQPAPSSPVTTRPIAQRRNAPTDTAHPLDAAILSRVGVRTGPRHERATLCPMSRDTTEAVSEPARVTRAALVVWGVAVGAYMLTVFIRSSLSVAGLLAADRFGITAAQLSFFTTLQLLVYAAMQVPAGLAIDRFGPRRALIAGITVLTLAQVGFALALTYPAAIIARVFIGGGDAVIFTSVLRLVSSWFPMMRIPLFTQFTGQLGQIGAMAATVPMTLLLRDVGWTATFATPAALGVVFVLLLLVLVRDTPTRRTQPGPPISRRRVVSTIVEVWARSGTKMGFWVHFSTPFSVMVFALLWGYPFLVQGQATDPIAAGVLLLLATFVSMLTAPLIGQFVAYRPFHRSTLVLASLAVQMVVWAAVLLWPGPAPLWLLVVPAAVIGVGGPVSMIGFDYARTSNPPAQLGGANGIVNQGGFIATVLVVSAVGMILDRLTPPGQPYGREAFGWAMSAQFLLWTIGIVQVARYRVRTRREFHDLDADGYERFRHHDLSVDWNLSVRPPIDRRDD